jgi:hypothetical protein
MNKNEINKIVDERLGTTFMQNFNSAAIKSKIREYEDEQAKSIISYWSRLLMVVILGIVWIMLIFMPIITFAPFMVGLSIALFAVLFDESRC